MLTTVLSSASITLSPQEVEQWPDTSTARKLATVWRHSRTTVFRLPAVDRAVPVCRHLTRLWLDKQHLTDEDLNYVTLLVTTELATNAIVHTGSATITAELQKCRSFLQIQVQDEGTKPTSAHWHNTCGYGRGLALIATSAQALGTRIERDGTRTIWARVSRT